MDQSIILFMANSVQNDLLNPFFIFITKLGNGGIFWIILAIILTIIPKTRKIGLLCGASLALTGLIALVIMKPIIARPRPYMEIESLTLLIPALDSFSMPSGHASSSFAAAIMLVLTKARFRWLALALAVLIAFSRIYLTMHYPSDVLVGALIGSLCACLIYFLYKKYLSKKFPLKN